jgi:hypothetical protein
MNCGKGCCVKHRLCSGFYFQLVAKLEVARMAQLRLLSSLIIVPSSDQLVLTSCRGSCSLQAPMRDVSCLPEASIRVITAELRQCLRLVAGCGGTWPLTRRGLAPDRRSLGSEVIRRGTKGSGSGHFGASRATLTLYTAKNIYLQALI